MVLKFQLVFIFKPKNKYFSHKVSDLFYGLKINQAYMIIITKFQLLFT